MSGGCLGFLPFNIRTPDVVLFSEIDVSQFQVAAVPEEFPRLIERLASNVATAFTEVLGGKLEKIE